MVWVGHLGRANFRSSRPRWVIISYCHHCLAGANGCGRIISGGRRLIKAQINHFLTSTGLARIAAKTHFIDHSLFIGTGNNQSQLSACT